MGWEVPRRLRGQPAPRCARSKAGWAVGESLVAGFAGTSKSSGARTWLASGVLGLWKVPGYGKMLRHFSTALG